LIPSSTKEKHIHSFSRIERKLSLCSPRNGEVYRSLQVSTSYLRVIMQCTENQIVSIGYDFIGEREMRVKQAIYQDVPEKWRKYTALWAA
jgi:hypothetical protein